MEIYDNLWITMDYDDPQILQGRPWIIHASSIDTPWISTITIGLGGWEGKGEGRREGGREGDHEFAMCSAYVFSSANQRMCAP